MIYNLFLNSTTNNPLTNYYSAVASANRGQRVYAVDWSFLPQNKNYKVTLRFSTGSSNFTANDLYYITANFGPMSNSMSAGSTTLRQANSILGILQTRQGNGLTTDLSLTIFPLDNQPVLLNGRPTNNFLEIKIMSNPTTQYALAVDYLMILSFEEVRE